MEFFWLLLLLCVFVTGWKSENLGFWNICYIKYMDPLKGKKSLWQELEP